MKSLFLILLHTTGPGLLPLLAVFVVAISACSPSPAPPNVEGSSAKPNIVLILIDDMGFNDLGANGNSSVTTPNLDSLAAEGVRFTRHYTDSTCTATRIGVLTGMDPASLGFRPEQLGISPEVQTLPELLRGGGYSTHHIGKWHVGFASRLAWPTEQGFDSFFGFLSQFLLRGPHVDGKWQYGPPTYRNPWLQIQSDAPEQYQGHLSEIFARNVEDFLDSKQNESTPWFLNFWMYAPHTPIQPMSRFSSQYPDNPEGRYLAFLEQLDATVGRVVDRLERNGLAENTLLLVASDNGGTNKQIDNNAPYFGAKASYFEGGVRTPLIIRWPGKFSNGQVYDGIVSNLDYLPTLVAAAGLKVPEALKGRDLRELVIGPTTENGPLYWEMSNSESLSWGILSGDGRWRMSQYFVGDPVLNDLEESPGGDKNVLSEHVDVGNQLSRQYRAWHNKNRVVHFNYERLQGNGRAKLLGESLQRSPGFSGHTFMIGVMPADDSSESQLIAYQENQWQLAQVNSQIVLTINGTVLEAPAPVGEACFTIIATSHVSASYLRPKKRRALIELYIDGEKSAEVRVERPEFPPNDYLHPTYIGQNAEGGNIFQGKLGRPVILNERLVTDDENAGSLVNDIAAVGQDLCRDI